jgi:hypothetical protein
MLYFFLHSCMKLHWKRKEERQDNDIFSGALYCQKFVVANTTIVSKHAEFT